MSSVIVEATQPGEYNGHYYEKGRRFAVVDRKHPEGDVLQYGIALDAKGEHDLSVKNQAFASHRHKGGWMKIVEGPDSTPAKRAQIQADLNSSAPTDALSQDNRPAGSSGVPIIEQGQSATPRSNNAGANDEQGPITGLDAANARSKKQKSQSDQDVL